MTCPHTTTCALPRALCAICRGEREVQRLPLRGCPPEPQMWVRAEPGPAVYGERVYKGADRKRTQQASESAIQQYLRAIDEGRRDVYTPATKESRA